jgi:hypothetical protein
VHNRSRVLWVAFLHLEQLEPRCEPPTTGGYTTAVVCERNGAAAEARILIRMAKAGFAVIEVESMRPLREVDPEGLRTKKFFRRFRRCARLRGRVRTTSVHTYPIGCDD